MKVPTLSYIPTDPKLRCNSGDTIKDFMSTFVPFILFLFHSSLLLATGNEGMNVRVSAEE